MFSKSVKHSIQAMIYLAENDEKLSMVGNIAEAYNIPKFYLAKLIQTLSKQRLIKSVKGRNGGICLNKPSRKIKIIDIIHAIEGPPSENEVCIFGLDVCADNIPCPIHSEWKRMKKILNKKLFNKNLSELNEELQRKHKLLKNFT